MMMDGENRVDSRRMNKGPKSIHPALIHGLVVAFG